ncbi:GNAT family N-acetyltransferase [Phaeobacter sp. QD34_3]|uniref:GNAT family N-acetyltransferase n=1 Tax=unclassified Phaeobacter TaxID=2621772 RepID=UPI00237F9787|nr:MULTISPECIES: GNAT family N-acetyltransferase [unclassified Phaeobacter]MDE4133203.1 GNAT family N-acetyltransferase [Phaeobacter sp. QD34_3]MDE4136727.1 GNAT family N-acetyltransferase [Phaeobacter sp. QD34_24]MDE4173034.1 GNAT family N-acetyltransferase [Phaeobacter sp. PT47_59]
MSLTLSLILPKEHAVLTSVLASYFEETASKARVDPGDRARQMLHRKDVTAFWVVKDSKRIGFALVLNLPDDRRELSEFSIFAPHRRQGHGQEAARVLLQEFPGYWRMGISAQSQSALAFWGTCLSILPGIIDLRQGAPFTEFQSRSYSFQIADPTIGPTTEQTTGSEHDTE